MHLCPDLLGLAGNRGCQQIYPADGRHFEEPINDVTNLYVFYVRNRKSRAQFQRGTRDRLLVV